jgi:4-diphosphocytidyl-2-C-methyl-D-erythritol kinase
MNWYPAPGKLNLFLHVLGRRADGYHLLQTAFRLIDRCDQVGIAVREDGRILRHDPLPGVAPEEDLCVRAARLLRERCGTRLGADLRVRKLLPVGGGLGGGSSDAATTLIVLNRLWGAGLPRGELQALAARLGADVPFFVFGENALGEGIGERLAPLPLPAAWYLVLVPPVALSTQEVFGDNALTRNAKELKIPPFFSGMGANDLEPVALRLRPEIAAHLAWLRERRPQARMTGSGACVFAEFATEAEARAVLGELPATMSGFAAQGLPQHPLRGY